MEIGDKVCAQWSDGSEVCGEYAGEIRGFLIVIDEAGKQVACDKNHVAIKVIKPWQSPDN